MAYYGVNAFPYLGGKNRNYRKVIEHLPRTETYVEPFCGSAGIYLNKTASLYNILNDADGAIIGFFRVLRDRPDELIHALALTPSAEAEFQKACAEPVVACPVETARRTYIRLHQSVMHTTRPDGTFAAISAASRNTRSVEQYHKRLRAVADALLRTTLLARDGLDVIRKYAGRGESVLIYCDPPYHPDTRTAGHAGNSLYAVDVSAEWHDDFLALVRTATSRVAISGYDHGVYHDALTGWRCERWAQPVHAGGNRPKAGRQGAECLWVNYPPEDGGRLL